jgi:hypothetical protein
MTKVRKGKATIIDLACGQGSEELVRSAQMRPYVDLFAASMKGQDTDPVLGAIAALPIEKRYVWRVVTALGSAFCDCDTACVTADVRTLSAANLQKIVGTLPVRAIQFCLFLKALIGEDAMFETMQHALLYAEESSVTSSDE